MGFVVVVVVAINDYESRGEVERGLSETNRAQFEHVWRKNTVPSVSIALTDEITIHIATIHVVRSQSH